jgi:serine/threonine protein kinase
MSCTTRNEKSDIYSLGVIFWEISSGRMPFENFMRDLQNRTLLLSLDIISGKREKVPDSTPNTYSLLYETCWHMDQTKRPTLGKIIKVLKKIKDMSISDVENILNLKGKNIYL